MSPAPSLTSYFKLHFLVLIWSFTAIIGVLVTVSPIALVFYRTMVAAAILWLVLYFQKTPYTLNRAEVIKLMATGSLLALHWILFFAAARISTVSVCLAGMSTASLWTSLLEPLVHKKPIKIRDVIFGLFAVLGLYIIFKFEFNHVTGLLVALTSAFLASLFVVANSQLVKHYNAVVITYYEMVGAAFFSLIAVSCYKLSEWGSQESILPTATDSGLILVLALVCTVYAYSMAANLMKVFSAFMMNLTINLEPVYGIIMAVLIFGDKEKMTSGFYVGTAIILASVAVYPLWLRFENRKNSSEVISSN